MNLGVKLALRTQAISLGLFCFALPLSIAGDDFSIVLLYLSGLSLLLARHQSWPKTALNYVIPAFLFFTLAASWIAKDVHLGLSGVRGFWRLGLPFMVALALTETSLQRSLKILGFTTLLIGAYAAVQHYTSIDILRSPRLQAEYFPENDVWRAVGAFSHHLTFGGVNLMVWPIMALLSQVRSFKIHERWFFGIAAGLSFFGAYASLGRSIWIGLFTSCLFLAAVKLKTKAWLITLPIGLLIIGIYTLQNSPALKAEVNKLSIGPRILMGIDRGYNIDRLHMWRAGRRAIADHPILGLGLAQGDRLQPYYDQIAKESGVPFQHKASTGVHNLYLQNLLDYGLLGALLMLVWWGYLFTQLFKQSRAAQQWDLHQALRYGIMAGMLGIWAAAFFENNFRDGEVQSMILFTHGIAIYLIQSAKAPQKAA